MPIAGDLSHTVCLRLSASLAELGRDRRQIMSMERHLMWSLRLLDKAGRPVGGRRKCISMGCCFVRDSSLSSSITTSIDTKANSLVTKTNKSYLTHQQQCKSRPSSSPSRPPPLPLSSSALPATSAQPSILPSAASSMSMASSTPLARLVCHQLHEHTEQSKQMLTILPADGSPSTVADFETACADVGSQAQCCTLPLVRS